FLTGLSAHAQTTGSISGTVRDATGSVIPDIAVVATNTGTNVKQTAATNADGYYVFATLPVGHYDLETFRPGFKPYKRTGLVIDISTKLDVDITLEVGEQSEEVTVSDTAVSVETESTQVGQVVNADVIDAVSLNGRSFTDLLALQPGIVP